MKDEEIDMYEILQTISDTVTIIQQDIRDLKKDLGDFKIEVRERFDKIESNMVKKENFNNLIQVLETKNVITKADSAYLLVSTNDAYKEII